MNLEKENNNGRSAIAVRRRDRIMKAFILVFIYVYVLLSIIFRNILHFVIVFISFLYYYVCILVVSMLYVSCFKESMEFKKTCENTKIK